MVCRHGASKQVNHMSRTITMRNGSLASLKRFASMRRLSLLRSLLGKVLVELLKNVRIKERLLGAFGVAGIKVANFAETLVLQQCLADVVILLGDFEIRGTTTA